MAGAGAAGSGDAASVLVVGADADGVAPSLLLTCNRGSKRQYLFGCAEGFSRLALEHRVRPTGKLRACFLTSFHPDACGGLGGTLLRLSGDGHGDLLVAGPSGVGAHIRALRRFVRFRHPQVTALRLVPPASVIDAAANPDDDHVAQTYEDDSIRVFPLYPRVQCQLCEAEAEAKRKRKRREDGAEEEDDEAPNKPPPLNTPGTSPANYFLGYAVSVKGTSDDEPGPTFLVLDCGDSDAAMDAGRHPTVECCLLGKHRCAAVFHVSDVRTHPTYDVCTWSRLDDNASLRDKWTSMCQNKYRGLNPREFLPLHVMCRVPNEVGFRAGARTLARLECVYRWAFPTPLTHHTPYKPPATPPKMPPVPLPPRIDGSLCTRVRLRVGGIRDWGFGLVESNGIAQADQTTERPEELDIETVQGETRRLMEDASIAEVEDKKFDGKREAQNFPELVFLGTGSAEPSRYRGSSAILIKRAGPLKGNHL
jgi:ribonuclease Z